MEYQLIWTEGLTSPEAALLVRAGLMVTMADSSAPALRAAFPASRNLATASSAYRFAWPTVMPLPMCGYVLRRWSPVSWEASWISSSWNSDSCESSLGPCGLRDLVTSGSFSAFAKKIGFSTRFFKRCFWYSCCGRSHDDKQTLAGVNGVVLDNNGI